MLRSILICIFFLPVIVSAQYQVKGSIQRPDSSAGRFIHGSIKKQKDTGITTSFITDTTGSFSIQLSDTGNYVLRFQSIFYQDTAISFFIRMNDVYKDLGPIRLKRVSATLKTVTVTAKKEILEFKEDHISFTPSSDPTIGSRPVTEILNRIPGISVDAKNNVTAKGQEPLQLLVNGRIVRSSSGDYLAQLNTDEIERIEVYDNAARFAYIKSPHIINVILKTKQPKKLWNAALTTNTLPKFNPSADASFSIGKHRLYSRVSHDISSFRTVGYLTRQSDGYDFIQNFNNRVVHQMSNFRLGADLFIDSTSQLTVEGNYIRHTDALNAFIAVKSPTGQFENHLTTSPVEKELNGLVSFKIDKKQKGYKLFEAGVTRFNLKNERDLPGYSLIEQREMNNYSVGLKAEWQKNIKQLRILNGIFSQLSNITDHVDTLVLSRALKSKVQNINLTSYHEINWQLKQWNVSMGTNIDYVQIKLNRSAKQIFYYQQTYANPSLRINKIKGKSRSSLSYNRKYILVPTHMMFGQYSQYEFGRSAPGNYQLKPSVQNIIRLSFANAKKITTLIEFFYEHTKNPVQMLSRINGTMIIDQPENLKQRKSFGAVFSLTYPVLPFYSFTLNSDARINQHRFQEHIFVLHPQTWSASASLVNRFTLNKKINIAVNASIHNWRTTLYRTMEKIVVIGMQGNYKINQKTNLSFSFNDMFNNMRFSYSGNLAPGFYERSFGKDRMRNLSISLRYQLINSQLDKKTSTVKSFMSE